MSTPTTPAAITRTPASASQAVITRFYRAAVGAWAKFLARRETAALLELDERLLHDIGLARGDIHDALAEPGAASAMLTARAARHRQAELDRLRASLRSAAAVTTPKTELVTLNRAA
jgi:uncharacterized protein YjiS (DUF1127 family)